MNWCFDIDGVITANPQAISWLTYHLHKNENDNKIFVITWRNGADEKRRFETQKDLALFNISYDELIMADHRIKNALNGGLWKIQQIRKHKIDVWFDDEIKIYRRDYNLDLEKLLPGVNKIFI